MMKKILSFMLIAVLALGVVLTGCGDKSQPEKKADETQQETQRDEKQDLNSKEVMEGNKDVPNPAKNRDNADDTLVVGLSASREEFLPIYYSDNYSGQIVGLVFDQLLNNDEEGNLIPALADYTISEDHKKITFTLKDAKFSDGTPLTAKDVAFTYTAICDPSYDGRYNSSVEDIVGYDEYHSEGLDEAGLPIENFDYKIKSVEGIKVIDDKTIEFNFKEPKITNIYNMTMHIMPEHIYGVEKGQTAKIREKMNKHEIVGSGRYKFMNLEPKQYVELAANDNWYGGDIKLKNIIVKFTSADTMIQELKAGKLDIQTQVPAKEDNKTQIMDAGFLNINSYPGNSYGFIGLNMKDERLSDVKVRQALVYGFNRKVFNQAYYGNNSTVCNSPMSQVSWAYTEDVNKYEYDPDKANQLLDEAGWKLNKDGIREKDGKTLDFDWTTYTDSKYIDTMIPLLKADWQKIGVKVTPNLMDFSAMTTKVFSEQDFTMFNLAWAMSVDPGDNYSTFHSKFDVPEGNNPVGLHDEEVDRLLEEGNKEFDKEKRKEIYQKFSQRINELVPYIFVNQTDQWDVCNARVKNFKVSPFCNWTYYIQDVELEK